MQKKSLALISIAGIAQLAFVFLLLTSSFSQINPTFTVNTPITFHLLAQQYRDGKLVSQTYHTMTTVNQGKDWIEQQLFNYNGSKALYIGVSNDSTSVSTSWTAIPNEITDGGLARALGSYVSTGVGAANVTYTFTASATRSTKLYGLYMGSGTTTTLVCAEQQGTGAQKNLNNGDTLKVTVQWSIT